MKIAILIPARYSSNRFEGKVIHPIKSKPMVQWVYEGVEGSRYADYIAVLTDDIRVFNSVRSFGGNVFMVKGNFSSGTDRVAYFCRDRDFDYVVNMQADEPLIDCETIDRLIECAVDGGEDMATLLTTCEREEVDDPNVVKTVVDLNGYALYFSRSRIPYNRKPFSKYLKHVGIYIYKKETLIGLSEMEPAELEIAEGLEQLRALQNGIKIKTCFTDKFLIGIDTKDDLKRLLAYLGEESG